MSIWKELRKASGIIFSLAILSILFVVFFTPFGIRDELSDTFWLEVFAGFAIFITVRFFFISSTEEANEAQVKEEINNNYEYFSKKVDNYNKFEKHLKNLDEENIEHFIEQRMKHLTKENSPKKYERLRRKAHRWVKPLRLVDFLSRHRGRLKYDSRNTYGIEKTVYQVVTAFANLASSAFLGYIMFDEFTFGWDIVARFVSYIAIIFITASTSVMWVNRRRVRTIIEQGERQELIIDKYKPNEIILKEEEVEDAKPNIQASN